MPGTAATGTPQGPKISGRSWWTYALLAVVAAYVAAYICGIYVEATMHPIFRDIQSGNLEVVKQRVLANSTVLEERQSGFGHTPLTYAALNSKEDIAVWMVEHKGQHNLDTRDVFRQTALHWACITDLPKLVQAMVGAGANPTLRQLLAARTPLMLASNLEKSNVTAVLLQVPAVIATIDTMDIGNNTALFIAVTNGRLSTVQLLLDAGADPSIPARPISPLQQAMTKGHADIAHILQEALLHPRRQGASVLDVVNRLAGVTSKWFG